MSEILVRNLSPELVDALKHRADRHHRSLQQEVVCILETSAREPSRRSAAELAASIRDRLARQDRDFGDSVELIRQDRGR